MAVLIQSPTSFPFPPRVAAPSRPGSAGQLLLTVALFLLLIVGRVAGYSAATNTVKKHSGNTVLLPSQRFQPVMRGTLPGVSAPAKTHTAALATAAH